MDNQNLMLHFAGPAEDPFPDLAAALRVVRNVRAELPGVRLELVVQGPGVCQLVTGVPDADQAAALAAEEGIIVAACRNSLRSAGVSEAALVDGVTVVPAAVAHLAQRQLDGAAYIRI